MIKIVKSGGYVSMFNEIKDPDLYLLILQKVKLFVNKPNDTRLDNHALRKRMKGKYAFSITDDIRIVYEWIGKKTVRFLAIGGHNKVYTR